MIMDTPSFVKFPYLFHSVRSTADALTLIIHRICVALDNKFITLAFTLDISKRFENLGAAT